MSGLIKLEFQGIRIFVALIYYFPKFQKSQHLMFNTCNMLYFTQMHICIIASLGGQRACWARRLPCFSMDEVLPTFSFCFVCALQPCSTLCLSFSFFLFPFQPHLLLKAKPSTFYHSFVLPTDLNPRSILKSVPR